MTVNDSPHPNAVLIQDAVRILGQASQKLEVQDYALAEIMIGVASQILMNARVDIEKAIHFERIMRQNLEA
jgi:hypothetical protein